MIQTTLINDKMSPFICKNGVYQNQAENILKLVLRPKMNFCSPGPHNGIISIYLQVPQLIVLSHDCKGKGVGGRLLIILRLSDTIYFMMMSSSGNIFRVTGPLCREFTGGQWRRALMFSLICTWINGWVNSCEAGDLKHHRAHYDITVMRFQHLGQIW